MKQSESHFHEFRGLTHHVRTWGSPDAPKLFLLHGWMDVSASFQFLVDGFQRDWHVIAPDWRGFGLVRPGRAKATGFRTTTPTWSGSSTSTSRRTGRTSSATAWAG